MNTPTNLGLILDIFLIAAGGFELGLWIILSPAMSYVFTSLLHYQVNQIIITLLPLFGLLKSLLMISMGYSNIAKRISWGGISKKMGTTILK